MNDKELSELMDLLYPFFIKKMKEDGTFKNCIKSTNATVVSESSSPGSNVEIKFPYDKTVITVKNKSTSEIKKGDLVCVHYYIDLKNALDTLQEEEKAIITMKYFEDKKLEEIAEILEENLSTVKSKLYRSMKKLKIRLAQ